MSKKIILTMLLVVATVSAWAQAISVNDAETVARNLFRVEGVQLRQADLQLVHTNVLNGTPCYYVFNRGNNDGFAIVGADESILGYADQGSFNIETAPAALRELLNAHSHQIAAGAKVKRQARASRSNVNPICKTKWSQEAPYNNFIPVPNNDPSLALATGCVATATAQVIKHFNYPLHGIGSHTYTCEEVELPDSYITMTFSADFASHVYDWDNMLDNYYDSDGDIVGNQTNWDAIALLMYDLGVASDMTYGALEATGSGTMTDMMADGLKKYFDYDCTYESVGDEVTEDEWNTWENKVYQELAAGYPIVYAGAGADADAGGHCFVLDGYQASTGMFHVNWGWAGSCDGYYELYDGLAPAEQGTGGVSDDYSYGQEMIYKVRPKNNTLGINDAVNDSFVPQKQLRNGQLIIRHNGHSFDAVGRILE